MLEKSSTPVRKGVACDYQMRIKASAHGTKTYLVSSALHEFHTCAVHYKGFLCWQRPVKSRDTCIVDELTKSDRDVTQLTTEENLE